MFPSLLSLKVLEYGERGILANLLGPLRLGPGPGGGGPPAGCPCGG